MTDIKKMVPKTCLLAVWLLSSAYALAQCTSGDCQVGTIAGPYTAPQVAENTATNFPVCKSTACTGGKWTADQIEGIDAQQNVGTSYQFYDTAQNLDTNIAVSVNATGKNAQVLQWVNTQFIQAYNKTTGDAIFSSAGGSTADPRPVSHLWSVTTQKECGDQSGNVQVIYDRLDNEFVIERRVAYTLDGVSHYAFCFALSSSSDISNSKTEWYAYEFKMDSVIPCLPSSSNCTTGSQYYYFPDWPRFGTWSNGFYLTFDLQNSTDGYAEAGFEACQLDRADMAKGLPANPITCYTYTIPAADLPILVHSVDVADIDSATGPVSGEPEYFVAQVNPSNLQQGGNGLTWCTSQTVPCQSHQLAVFTWGSSGLSGPAFLNVNPYTPGCYDTTGPGRETNTVCVPEPSTNSSDIEAYGVGGCGDFTTPCVDSLGDRLANRLTYNNLSSSGSGPNGEYLTVSHVVMEDPTTQANGVRYYILSVSDGTASVLVNSGGTGGPPDLEDSNGILSYFMPSAALDKNGNLGITYTVSGPSCTTCEEQPEPAVYFDVLPWGTTSFDNPTLIIAGTGDEENTYHWGQYAATVIDSSDGLTFYGVGEYFNTSQKAKSNCSQPSSECFTWQTRIFRGKYGVTF